MVDSKDVIVGSNDKDNLSVPSGRSYMPPLPSDPVSSQPQSLAAFREQEGRANRKRRLQELWKSLPDVLHEPHIRSQAHIDPDQLMSEKAESLQQMYDRELLNLCSTHPSAGQAPHISWKRFKEFAEKKEAGKSLSWHSVNPYFDQIDVQ
jgi:solute carrier family 25 phosphate transporter 23/24/25/41